MRNKILPILTLIEVICISYTYKVDIDYRNIYVGIIFSVFCAIHFCLYFKQKKEGVEGYKRNLYLMVILLIYFLISIHRS